MLKNLVLGLEIYVSLDIDSHKSRNICEKEIQHIQLSTIWVKQNIRKVLGYWQCSQLTHLKWLGFMLR